MTASWPTSVRPWAGRTGAAVKTSSVEGPELYLTLVSLGLLLMTCIQASPVRELAVLVWLTSFAILTLWNIGAAFAVYIAAVALYSSLFSGGSFSVFERPDHPALLILLVSIGLLRSSSRSWSIGWLTLAVVGFLLYGVGNGLLTGTFSMASVAAFARTYGIPLLLILLVMRAGTNLKDLRLFLLTLFIVGGYSALVSWLWQTGPRELIFPSWINDPEVNRWHNSMRSGGVLMQPAWNGLMLGLMFCLVYLGSRTWIVRYGRLVLLGLGASIVSAIYFTFTRAAYLGVLLAIMVLFWGKAGDARRTTLKRVLLSVVAVVGIAFAALSQPAKLESRVGDESTVVWRFEIWEIALNMIPARPVFGFGFRGYNKNAVSFFEGGDVITRQGLESSRPAVHNLFLNLMVELGLVGFSLYVALLWFLFKGAAQTCREFFGRRGVVWVLVFMGVYLVQAQFAVPQDPAPNLVFYGTLGLLAGMSNRDPLRTRSPRRSAGANRRIQPAGGR